MLTPSPAGRLATETDFQLSEDGIEMLAQVKYVHQVLHKPADNISHGPPRLVTLVHSHSPQRFYHF